MVDLTEKTESETVGSLLFSEEMQDAERENRQTSSQHVLQADTYVLRPVGTSSEQLVSRTPTGHLTRVPVISHYSNLLKWEA